MAFKLTKRQRRDIHERNMERWEYSLRQFMSYQIGFLKVPKHWILEIGLRQASLLCILYDLQKMAQRMGEDDCDWFPCSPTIFCQITGLTKSQERGFFNLWKKRGVIQVKRVGLPASRWVLFSMQKLDKFVSNREE